MRQRGESNMARQIKDNTEMFVKLVACGMVLQTAQAKLNAYLEKNLDIYSKAMEDEESLAHMKLYYTDDEAYLLSLAEESVVTASEVETLIDDQGDLAYDEERD